jgi:RNA polymerase sigma-70 factor, ECF subfamily
MSQREKRKPQMEVARTLPTSESDLVAAAIRGDAAAFRSIIQLHNRRLFRAVRGIVRETDEAEDVVQETWVRAYAALPQFRGDAALATWLTRIALNEAMERRRRGKHMTSFEGLSDAEKEGGEVVPFPLGRGYGADPERNAANAEIRRVLECAIDELPVPFRTVFIMRAVEQMSTEETASCLGVPEETVKTRFHRAKRRLREAVADRLETALVDTFPFAGARCERVAERVMKRLGLGITPPD